MSVPITKEGLEKLSAELKELEEHRPRVLLAIKEAREKGDLSENADYHAAREDLAMTESRINLVKGKLAQAVLVDTSKIGGNTIVFGATVKVLELKTKEEEEYTLVGEGEADPLANKILTSSPMGQALLTRKAGETIEVSAPKGTLKFKILEIRYG